MKFTVAEILYVKGFCQGEHHFKERLYGICVLCKNEDEEGSCNFVNANTITIISRYKIKKLLPHYKNFMVDTDAITFL